MVARKTSDPGYDRATYPVVHYEDHPAFDFPVPPGQAERDEAFDAAIFRLDAILEPVRSGAGASTGTSRSGLQHRVGAVIESVRPLLYAEQGTIAQTAINTALGRAQQALVDQAIFAARSAEIVGIGEVRAGSALVDQGAIELSLDPTLKAKLQDALMPHREEVRVGTRQRSEQAVLPTQGIAADRLLALLAASGIPECFEHHYGLEYGFHYWTLNHSVASDSWWKGCYSEFGLPTSASAYFHLDQDFSQPKVIIYLSDVGEEHGPFEYLPGSHRWQRSTSLELLTKALERESRFHWRIDPAPYYRPQFKRLDYRRSLMLLPRSARHQSHFGDDILPDSAVEHLLATQKRTILSKDADCIAFLGSRVTHRGGLTCANERWALQIGFRPRPGRWTRATNRFKSRLRSLR